MAELGKTAPSIRFLDEETLRPLLRLEDLIPAMERALADFSAGRVVQPVRSIVPVTEHRGFMGVMPAVYGDVMGAKLVTFYPANAALHKPTHQAMIQLFDATTGEPLAVMDGRLITEMRTAAVSAIAADLLAPRNPHLLAILGSGVQARSHFAALSRVRTFKEIRVWSRTPAHAQKFAGEIGARTAARPEQAVAEADIVLTLTSSPEPILFGKWLKNDAIVCAVGAVTPNRRELDTEAMRGPIVVESREAAEREPGDIVLANAQISAELGELLAGKALERKDGPIVFKSVGIAIEDIAAAKLVYEKIAGGP